MQCLVLSTRSTVRAEDIGHRMNPPAITPTHRIVSYATFRRLRHIIPEESDRGLLPTKGTIPGESNRTRHFSSDLRQRQRS